MDIAPLIDSVLSGESPRKALEEKVSLYYYHLQAHDANQAGQHRAFPISTPYPGSLDDPGSRFSEDDPAVMLDDDPDGEAPVDDDPRDVLATEDVAPSSAYLSYVERYTRTKEDRRIGALLSEQDHARAVRMMQNAKGRCEAVRSRLQGALLMNTGR